MENLMVEQGSVEWLNARLGVITASNVSKALAKKGTETRNSYLMELVGQVATREVEEIFGKALEWGKANESAARAAYEFETGKAVQQVGLFYAKDKRFGASPDGIIPDLKKGLEIKCPMTPKVHVDFLANDKIKSEYLMQIQFGLYVTGLETWDFASFHAKFKAPGTMLKFVTIERDSAMFERFDNELGEFILDMDKILSRLGLVYGSQWARS
jgi:putative phage-type endonuclease